MMDNIAVIGANGGIGLAMVEALHQRYPEATLWASHHRTLAPRCREVAACRWFELDLRQDASINQAAETLAKDTDQLDMLMICSGWLHDDAHQPEKSLRDLEGDAFATAMRINAVGPLLVIAGLANLLTRRSSDDKGAAKVVALSAKVGSISDNSLGGWHAYRMSKAALNMGVKNLGIEFARSRRKPLIAAVHPGTTHTALSDPFAKRGLDVVAPEITAERLLQFTTHMDAGHQGGFYHWDGSVLPW